MDATWAHEDVRTSEQKLVRLDGLRFEAHLSTRIPFVAQQIGSLWLSLNVLQNRFHREDEVMTVVFFT